MLLVISFLKLWIPGIQRDVISQHHMYFHIEIIPEWTNEKYFFFDKITSGETLTPRNEVGIV